MAERRCCRPSTRALVDGIDLADSLTWDAHKMMFVPALCAFLLYRRKSDSYRAFHQTAPYLFDPSAPELIDYDGGLRTVECTKRGMVLGLWGVWSMFGKALLAELVERTFDMGAAFHRLLEAAPDFEPLHVPECNIVVFRHRPLALRDAPEATVGEFHHALRRTVCKSGRFYIVPCSLDGRIALRCTIINPLTTVDHLAELLDTLRETGQSLLSEPDGSALHGRLVAAPSQNANRPTSGGAIRSRPAESGGCWHRLSPCLRTAHVSSAHSPRYSSINECEALGLASVGDAHLSWDRPPLDTRRGRS